MSNPTYRRRLLASLSVLLVSAVTPSAAGHPALEGTIASSSSTAARSLPVADVTVRSLPLALARLAPEAFADWTEGEASGSGAEASDLAQPRARPFSR
jgi:hypothetical protein